MARFSILITLLVAAAALAQPLAGPFTLLQQPAVNLSLGYVGGAAHDSEVDVLFIAQHNLLYLAADLDDGTITAPLTQLLIGDPERQLTVPALRRVNDGWAATVHEYDEVGNDTWYYYGQDGLHGEMLLASSWNYCDPDAYITSGSRKLCFEIAPQRNGLSALGWVDAWCSRVGGGWEEGGNGNRCYLLNAVAPPDTHYHTNVFDVAELRLQVLRPDSVVALASGYSGLTQWALPTAAYHPEFVDRNCPGRLSEWLLTHGGRSLVLMRDPGRLVELTATACDERLVLDRQPLAWTSHPDYGVAWIAQAGGSLVLYRADTTGTLQSPDGIMGGIAADYELAGCALTMTDEGRVVLLWTENPAPGPGYPRLRLVSAGWDTPLSADELPTPLHPSSFRLHPFPNPFNAVTTVRFDLPRAGEARVAVYDVLGREVAVLHKGVLAAGAHALRWDARAAAAGVYFVQARTDAMVKTAKVLLVK